MTCSYCIPFHTKNPTVLVLPHGQALAAGLVVLTVVGLLWVGVYNVGQVALGRASLAHATDAAAYSAAIAQARTLNMLAHVQRAQVAHQVALAHIVTLSAWSTFAQAEARRFAAGNPPGMLIGMLFGPAHGTAYAGSVLTTGSHARTWLDALHRHERTTHDVLGATARRMVSDLPKRRHEVIAQVLGANFPSLVVGSGASSQADIVFRVDEDNWRDVLTRLRGERSLTLGAVGRYGFLDPREYTQRNPWPVSHRCPWRRHELRRRGGTWMDRQGRWHAMDTQSYHALRSNKWVGCYYREYAMGWGVAVPDPSRRFKYSDDAPSNFGAEDFWVWVNRATDWSLRSRRDNPMANSYGVAGAWQADTRGLPARYAPGREAATGARFRLYVHRRAATLPLTSPTSNGQRTSHDFMKTAGRFAFDVFGSKDVVRASAAAVTEFRPPRDGRSQQTSGTISISTFRPYWQARLADLSGGEPSKWPLRQPRRLPRRRPGLWLRPRLQPARRFLRVRIQPRGPSHSSRLYGCTGIGRSACAGQAMVESMLMLAVLGTLTAGVALIGRLTHQQLDDQHLARVTAFTGVSGGAPTVRRAVRGPLQRENPPRLSSPPSTQKVGLSQERGDVLTAQPGGDLADAQEMRRSWAYADKGLLSARVGTRFTVVARDAGHRSDDGDTQKRVGASRAAWTRAAAPTLRAAKRLSATASRVDAGWGRPLLSTDWLSPWSDLDTAPSSAKTTSGMSMRRGRRAGRRRVHRRRASTDRPVPGGRINLSPVRHRRCSVSVSTCCRRTLQALVVASLLSAPTTACPLMIRSEPSHAVMRTAGQRAAAVAERLAGLALPGADAESTGFLWSGRAMAIRTFRALGSTASVAQWLSGIVQPLRDLAVVDGQPMLAGSADGVHWMARWRGAASIVNGQLSGMVLGQPFYATAAPAWLPADTTTLLHVVALRRGETGAGIDRVQGVWQTVTATAIARAHIAAALHRTSWRSDDCSGCEKEPDSLWRDGARTWWRLGCALTVDVSAPWDTSGSSGVSVSPARMASVPHHARRATQIWASMETTP